MVVEVKDYGIIGKPRLLNLQVLKINYDDLIKENYDKVVEVYSGKSEDIPEEIANCHYYKIKLGDPTIYYVVLED